MGGDWQQILILVGGLILLGALMLWPQWRARKRREEQMSELSVGDRILTIGGLIGSLTALDQDSERARLKIAEGVEIEILTRAIAQSIDEEQGEAQDQVEA